MIRQDKILSVAEFLQNDNLKKDRFVQNKDIFMYMNNTPYS